MNRKPPKQATKTYCPRTLAKISRLLTIDGLTVEDIAYKVGISPRQARRKIDAIKTILGVTCDRALVHVLNAAGLIYACEQEAKHWISDHLNWRKAA